MSGQVTVTETGGTITVREPATPTVIEVVTRGERGLQGTTAWSELTGKPTTVDGFGITDVPDKVRATPLTGIDLVTDAPITAVDTVLSAFGKIFAKLTAHITVAVAHFANVANPHGVTKAQVGLGNADNTSDANKPVSTAQQAALDAKAALAGSAAQDFAADDLSITTLNGGQLAGLRNKIINGKMDISQRGTSFAAIGNSVYSLDRWGWYTSSAAVNTVIQSTDVPADNEFQNSLRATVTTADAAVAAGDLNSIYQSIEGYNARDLIGKSFAISFRVRSSKTGTHCVSLCNSAADRSYVTTYTVNAANTWETKYVVVPAGLITAGTWNWTTGTGLQLRFALMAGTTFQTTAGVWQNGNFFATAAQVNCMDTVGNIFAITGVQLEVGSVATPFEHRPIGVELALCQRYYQKSYDLTTNPGTAVDGAPQFSWSSSATGSIGGGSVTLAATMRASPTLVVYDLAGTSGVVSALSSGAAVTNGVGINAAAASTRTVMVRIYNVAYSGLVFHYTASAEL